MTSAGGRPAKPDGRTSTYERIYQVIARIPRGRVATYGQIARLAGLAGHARQVGYALHSSPDERKLPWQRVINARGEISLRSGTGEKNLQRALLESEGVVFNADGRVDLQRYGWVPGRRSPFSTWDLPVSPPPRDRSPARRTRASRPPRRRTR